MIIDSPLHDIKYEGPTPCFNSTNKTNFQDRRYLNFQKDLKHDIVNDGIISYHLQISNL